RDEIELQSRAEAALEVGAELASARAEIGADEVVMCAACIGDTVSFHQQIGADRERPFEAEQPIQCGPLRPRACFYPPVGIDEAGIGLADDAVVGGAPDLSSRSRRSSLVIEQIDGSLGAGGPLAPGGVDPSR